MDKGYFILNGVLGLLALMICRSSAMGNSPIIRVPISAPVYVSQQPVNTGYIYPYYYYPQPQYPNTGVVYQPSVTAVQYPYYSWSNNPAHKPSIPLTPTATSTGGNTGDPNNPKNDVEYIY